ncbi:Neutrophil cytosol factor 2 [Chytriomyces hyalinus]|nr:Neutrophil cytosol factor 2 [Chytriomyces hyalinus]
MPSVKDELLQWNDACQLFEAKDYKQSLILLDAIADTSKIHFSMGIAFINIKKEEQAIAALSKAIACDKYMAIAYYVRGILFFRRDFFAEAIADFSDALENMRSNLIIDYTQIGMAHKLHAFEIAFNRGLCYSANGKMDAAIADFDDADRMHPSTGDKLALEEKIDQAVDLGDRAVDYVNVFEMDYSKAVFKPSEEKVKNAKRVNYLGSSKVVAGVDETDAFAGFSGTLVKSQKNLVNSGPFEGSGMGGSETLTRKKSLTDVSVSSARKEKADAARAATLTRMRIDPVPDSLSRRPSAPIISSRNSSMALDPVDISKLDLGRGTLRSGSRGAGGGTTLKNEVSESRMSDKIRVKCNYKGDTRQIMVPMDVTFKELQTKIQKKFESSRPLRLKYKDGDAMVMMSDEEDMEIAFDIAGVRSGKSVEVWMPFKSPEGPILCAWFAFYVLSISAYYLRRHKPLIKARPAMLTINQTVSNISAVFFIQAAYLATVPCFVRVWAINFSVVIWTTTTLVRNFQLYVQYRFNQNLLFKDGKAQASGSSSAAVVGPVDEFGYPIGNTSNSPTSPTAPLAELKSCDYTTKTNSAESLARKGVGLKRAFIKLTDKWIIDKVVYKRINRIIIMLYAITGSYLLVVQFFAKSMAITPVVNFKCTFDLLQYGLLVGGVFFLLICGGVFSMWLIHDISDSNFITYDCLITYCVGLPSGIIFLLFQQIPSLARLSFDASWIIIIPLFTSQITSIAIPVLLTFWEDYRSMKVKIDMNLTSFKAALEERQLFQEIKEYAIRDMCGENVFFLEALKELKKNAITEFTKGRPRAPSCSQRKSSNSVMQSSGFTVSKASKIRSTSVQTSAEPQEGLKPAELPSIHETSYQTIPRPDADLTSVRRGTTSVISHESQSRSESLDFIPSNTRTVPEHHRTRRSHKDTLAFDKEPVPPSLVYKFKQFDSLYCVVGGQMEVNLSADARRNLNRVRETDDWRIGTFDQARLEILNVLFTNVYCRWAHQRLEKGNNKMASP